MPQIFETACRPLALEMKRRTIGPRELAPGGWYGEGDLLLATRRTMLAVRVVDGARCHWLDLRDAEPRWSVAVPRIDLARRTIDDVPQSGRVIATRPPGRELARARRRRATRRDDAQLELPFEDRRAAGRVEKREAVARFFASIPPRHRAAIAPARPRWQWELLLLFEQGGLPAVELLESTPALAFALALAPLFREDQKREAGEATAPRLDEILGWRQGRIAELLGLPGSRRGVRALRKLELPELDAALLLTVKRLLRDERVLSRVSHLPRLSGSLVRVGHTPEGFLALERDLQLALLDPRRGPRLAGQFERIVDRMRRMRDRGYALPDTIRSVRHAATVTRAMDSLVDEIGALDAPDTVAPAPFPGIPGVIEPLRCVGDFHAEGETMRSCVRTYAGAAMAGSVAVYRVLRPERATVSLMRCSPSRWRLGELLAVANAPVRAQTRRDVDRWLELWSEPVRVAVGEEAGAEATRPVYDAGRPVDFEGGDPFDGDAFDAPGPDFGPAWPDDVPF